MKVSVGGSAEPRAASMLESLDEISPRVPTTPPAHWASVEAAAAVKPTAVAAAARAPWDWMDRAARAN